MSLKQKNERAFRAVVDDSLPADSPIVLVTSQENQEVVRGKQMFSFDDQGGPERPLRSGVYYRMIHCLAKTSFDKQEGATTNPEDVHAANLTILKDVIKQANLAALLSAAQDGYHVLGIIDHGEVEVDPDSKGRAFMDGYAIEVVCIENDC